MSAAGFVQWVVQSSFSGATGFTVVSTQGLDAATQAEFDRQLAEANAQANQTAGEGVYTIGADLQLVTFDFTDNGVARRGEGFTFINWSEYHAPGYSLHTAHWGDPSGIFLYIADRDVYDQYAPAATTFVANFILSQAWVGARQAVSDYVYQQKFAQDQAVIQAQQQAFQQQAQSYTNSYSGSPYSSTSDSNSRVMDGWTDVIAERDNWESPDGGVTKIDTRYDYNYYDSNGNIYSYETMPGDVPSDWTEMNQLPSVLPGD
jgi:hypothetical protein